MEIDKEFITKIEGHGQLHLDAKKNKVKLEIFEGERLFEGLVVKRPVSEMPWLTSRICGVCPIAHNLASLKAIESALKITISSAVEDLRNLMVIAQMVQSHALHLYFLALPDYLNLDSGLEISEKYPKNFKDALMLKEFSDDLAEVVAGRRVHPTTTVIGGFHKIPKKSDLEKLLKFSGGALEAAENTVKLFSSLNYPKINAPLVFLSLFNNKNYAIYDGEFIISNKKFKDKPENYKKFIEEKVRDDSTAKFGFHKGKGMMVGALARLNLQNKFLNPLAKKYFEQSKINFKNPYYNNLAQAIEVLHFMEQGIKLIQKILKSDLKNEEKVKVVYQKESIGVGVIEAPRGGLYHELEISADGTIKSANIITPTVQNLTSIEEMAQLVLDNNKKASPEEKVRLMEMLVRAYDPCITCSVH